MVEFDAFDNGIELGGLRNRDEIKLLICYLVKSVDRPITKQILNEALQENGLVNYFEINGALAELMKSGNITSEFTEDDELLYITEKGKNAAEILETTLPKTVRERAINSAIRLMTIARREHENKIDIVKRESGGYDVTFTLFDKDEVLMQLTVFASDSMQAQTLKKNFLNDPVKLYSNILAALTV